MMKTFDISGFTVTVGTLVAAMAVVQWIVFALITAVSRETLPKSGMRSADKRLIGSTLAFAIAWVVVFSTGGGSIKTAQAAMVSTKTHGSCGVVTTDMAASVVRQKVGEPDEIRSDEETRGPGAAIWIYRDSRCAVHIFDEKVEFVD